MNPNTAIEPRPLTATPRVHYIDWLRVLAVLLLFPFHTLRVFNYEPFYVKGAELSQDGRLRTGVHLHLAHAAPVLPGRRVHPLRSPQEGRRRLPPREGEAATGPVPVRLSGADPTPDLVRWPLQLGLHWFLLALPDQR